MAIELAYINTKHPDFADACGLMNNNIEVNTIQVVFYKREKICCNSVIVNLIEHGITIKHTSILLSVIFQEVC